MDSQTDKLKLLSETICTVKKDRHISNPSGCADVYTSGVVVVGK